MAVVAHHAVLALATAALGGAALRLASRAAPSGLDRLTATVTLAAAAAVIEALALGLVGLGTSPVALPLTAGATWLAARVWLPVPAPAILAELAGWWLGLGKQARTAIGVLAGLGAAWTAWLLANPSVGVDGVVYHLTEIVGWVHGGHPGSIQRITYGFPIGNYPMTEEVLLAWGTGISRSFVPSALSTPLFACLIVLAGWSGMRTMGLPRAAAGLALAALVTSTFFIQALPGPDTDVAAVAWLVTAGTLVAKSGRRSALLPVAVVAGGLAVGTKTTVLPPLVVLLAIAIVRHRRSLTRLAVPIGLAALAAAVVGGTWYVRNLIDHGSPLWPFVAAPWGDPLPRYLARTNASFLDHPRATLSGRLDEYAALIAGGLVLFAGAFAAAAVARTRAAIVAAGATALALLSWANAPFTGVANSPYIEFVFSTTRYLLAAIALSAFTLAVAARAGSVARRSAIGLLAAAIAWNLIRAVDVGFPSFPAAEWLATGAAVGALAARAAMRLPVWRGPLAARAALAAAAGVALVPGATGFVARHGNTHQDFDASVVKWFASQKAFADDGRPIASFPLAFGVLAGDRLQHSVSLVAPGATCADVRARARRGWVVVRPATLDAQARFFFPELGRALDAVRCLQSERPVYDNGFERVYRLGAET